MDTAYCLSEKMNRKFRSGSVKVSQMKNGTYHASGVCASCGKKMSRILSKSQGHGLLSMLGIPIPDAMKNIPLLGPLLF